MIVLLLTIANITGGILLGLATLDKWDGEKNYFNKIAAVLAPFQTIIGGTLIVLGAIRLFGAGNVIFNIISILGGFLLLTHVIVKIKSIGSSAQRFSDTLSPFKAVIGIALIVIALLTIF